MKVTITYHDNDSFTVEEIVRQATLAYGKAASVDIQPESPSAYDNIYFGIQRLVTHEQLSLIYDRGANYQSDIKKLRDQTLYKLADIVDQVIVDNESRVG